MDHILSAVQSSIQHTLRGTVAGHFFEDNVVQVITDFMGGTPRDQALANFTEMFNKTMLKMCKDDDSEEEFDFYFCFGETTFIMNIGFTDGREGTVCVDVRYYGSHSAVSVTEGWDWRKLAQETFDFCDDAIKCRSCSKVLASPNAPSFGICERCQWSYNKKGCSVCHGYFGKIIEGKHSWCK